MRLIISILIILFCGKLFGQAPVVNLIQPFKTNNPVNASRQFLIGNTCKNCGLTINGKPAKVYPTGAFAYELNLKPGDTSFTITASIADRSASKKINYTYTLPKPAQPVKELGIESIETFPEDDLVLVAGDKIRFKVKGLPNCIVKAFNNTVLYELPKSQTKGMPGIYQGEYIVKESDNFSELKIPVTIEDSSGTKITRETKNTFSVLSPLASNVAITKGRLAHLEYGLGDDRLGGAKVGYLDSNILLKITGKVGTHYRVQLSKSRTAYIPDEHVALMPKGTFVPESLTDKWNVYGDSVYDYVRVGLFAKLPYQSFQLIDPSKIVVDVFGATNNTNWITQLQTAREIKNIYYEQIEDDIFRITIELRHAQHWGHQIYYSGNNLMIKIKQQPENLSLKNLTIAVDAGHGGTNNGAVGATGSYEKEITLDVSLKLKKALEKEGAKVIMTRTKEQFFDNKERILFYRDSLPDLLLSIHLNSSEDPIRTGGTSTYYRYIGFRNLSLDIYKRMLELGLKEYGNTGSFNFMLNSPIEYPNALIETLFLSNLDEETKILDDAFQQKMVDKIVLGVKDFLNDAAK
ncbi:N-acetylmuramoyl-L-alanine amidase [Ferruginibacter lapsinanis]|uniref:N-acetylmuramoyl-L-alanine amidase n=1 Tax=Ferruginibacter lapsinanis TaxID=563172 RepID=UPI001E5018A9|nr:N-acetylmuramoyl-L-alanine amidase [Ferruginibacter lapsinanis]UEG50670.1 N-acetylmuramoyl-L-alanine amidase [Ferruginibacter lapsinanis]